MTAGIDFGLRLMSLIRGQAHAEVVQLSLEYDPAPPFDAGSPERASVAVMDAYERRIAALVPDRDDRLRALARRRGFVD